MNSVRPINKGTVYDISGNLKKLARDIESGQCAEVTDVLVVVRQRRSDGTVNHQVLGLGRGESAQQYVMAEVAARKILRGGNL